ncbi:hypothetical protein PRIPAC_78703 [Pristionchus pacificus]|uniref:Transmembrane ion channel n=1 Tax=Pristionchus pacificus TaxID=54126 RepID=A0A8R1YEC2_PRIPA|nr:hypothetical protein PRIPAC_78703 [Pristionchus pacificus]|eukprot:PDM79683.1 transmembrane ion channel [Pristionchus pacificus]
MVYSITLSRNPQFWIGLVVIPTFMLGLQILIGLFFSGKDNLENNAIGFGLTTMMSMMVIVGILNDSLNKIKSLPCMGLFVLIQIAVTSVAVVAVLLIDKFKSVSKRHRQYTHNLDLRTHFQPRKISPLRDHSVSNLGRTLTSTDALHTIFCVAHWKFCVANVQSVCLHRVRSMLARVFIIIDLIVVLVTGTFLLIIPALIVGLGLYGVFKQSRVPLLIYVVLGMISTVISILVAIIILTVLLVYKLVTSLINMLLGERTLFIEKMAFLQRESHADYMVTLNVLKNDLFHAYDKNVAPMQQKGAFSDGFKENVSMMVTYAKLTSVNERSMEYSIVLGMMLMWNDPRLGWNPQLFGNISHIYTTLEQVWFPNFHPCESSSITYLALGTNQVAKIFPNGNIRTILQAEITYSCAFNVSFSVLNSNSFLRFQTERFPFDVQSCSFCFAINGYDSGDISFSATLDPTAQKTFATDMSEWRVKIDNSTSSFDYCANDICMTIIFMLGFLILIGLFSSGKANLVNNAIGFGLTTMMSMMVVVAILNDSLSKIESIPCMGLFVLIQIAVTTVAVVVVLLTDKLKSVLWSVSRRQRRDTSRFWGVIRSITRDEHILRLLLFILFSVLHIANFLWLMSNQGIPTQSNRPYLKRTSPSPSSPSAQTTIPTTPSTLPPIRY